MDQLEDFSDENGSVGEDQPDLNEMEHEIVLAFARLENAGESPVTFSEVAEELDVTSQAVRNYCSTGRSLREEGHGFVRKVGEIDGAGQINTHTFTLSKAGEEYVEASEQPHSERPLRERVEELEQEQEKIKTKINTELIPAIENAYSNGGQNE